MEPIPERQKASVVAVEVTVESGKITGVEVTSAEKEDGAYLSMAEDVISEILEAQSADVDTVSGSTFSSTAIRYLPTRLLRRRCKHEGI